MANSILINNNEEYVRDAVNNGISANAISRTMEDMLKKSDEVKRTPKQVKNTIGVIASMKKSTDNRVDERYSSEFVRNNSARISNALNDGISSNEIATTLVNSINTANNNKGKKRLNFIVKLISKMKKKELILSRQNGMGKSYQKIKE